MLAAAAGAPFPAVAGLDAKKEIRFVPVSKEQIVALRLAIPELTAVTIAPGTYPSLLKSYQTVGLYNFAIASSNLPIDLVYRIVDVVFANRDAMMEVHPAAAATSLQLHLQHLPALPRRRQPLLRQPLRRGRPAVGLRRRGIMRYKVKNECCRAD